MSADQEIAYLRTTLGVSGGTLNDLRMQAYGGTGTQSERAAAFWRAGGATGNTLEELEVAYLRAKTANSGSVTLADLRQAWFASPTAPAPKIVASETWTGADGAAWPAQWTPLANNGAVTIQGNQGFMNANAVNYVPNRRAVAGLSVRDVELFVKFTPQSLEEAYLDFCVHQDLTRNQYFPDGYFVSCDIRASDGLWTLGSIDTNNGQAENTDYSQVWEAGVPFGLRFRAKRDPADTTRSILQARVWKISAGEPTTWQQTKTLSTYERAGSVALGYLSGASTNAGVKFDDMQVTDLS